MPNKLPQLSLQVATMRWQADLPPHGSMVHRFLCSPRFTSSLRHDRATDTSSEQCCIDRPMATICSDNFDAASPRVARSGRCLTQPHGAPPFTSRALEHFLVTGDLTIVGAWRGLFAHARRGRPGITALRTLLQRWALDTQQPESVLEAKMLSLCFINKLPEFEFQAQIDHYRVDFLWREQRVIAECDGFAYHGSSRERFEMDRQRDNYLQSLGYTVWRFSFRQIVEEPDRLGQQLRAAFRSESC